MKRSEMITRLKVGLFGEEVRPEPLCGFSDKLIEDFSDSILQFLESQGMQPPPINVEAFLVPEENGQPAAIPYTTISNEWEPEE